MIFDTVNKFVYDTFKKMLVITNIQGCDTIMNVKTEKSSDKILAVTVKLMAEKGYKAVTIKEIANAAGLSEMTVFRAFGTKKAILDTIIENYMYSMPIEQIIREQLTYDLEVDLLMLSRFYQEMSTKNQEVFLISILERKTMPEIHLKLHDNVAKFRKVVVDYLATMQEKGRVVAGNPQIQASTLMQFNYGKFVANTLIGGGVVPSISDEEYLQEAVSIITKGLKA